MESDPFAGDVKPLRGAEWKGRFCKRVGRYRIVFTTDRKIGKVAISAILVRSEKRADDASAGGTGGVALLTPGR